MHIRQYAYFALFSSHTPAAEMTASLGLEPDETAIRGSRRTEPDAVPVQHSWKIVCRDPALRVDEQIAHIIARLTPHTAAIAALARRLHAEDENAGAVLEVVRYFNDEEPDATGETLSLFGWHLDRDLLDFLHATGAALHVDEYDLTPDV